MGLTNNQSSNIDGFFMRETSDARGCYALPVWDVLKDAVETLYAVENHPIRSSNLYPCSSHHAKHFPSAMFWI